MNLGNRVWFDPNNDGLDNDGPGGAPESGTGVGNVRVALFTAGGQYVAETTTSASGYYTFSGLAEGEVPEVDQVEEILLGLEIWTNEGGRKDPR